MKEDDGRKELENYMVDAREGDQSLAGCTATVILINNKSDAIYCANAGDSRTVLSTGGTSIDLSKDHKPDDHSESSRIYQAGGSVEEGRVNGTLALSRALGDFEYK